MNLERELEVAIEAARQAEELILAGYAQDVSVEYKADESPVTAIDIAAEKAIKSAVMTAFPADDFLGEESGHLNRGAERLWIVDPLDGTKSFIRKTPFVSTQIALQSEKHFVLGVSNAPLMQEMAFAYAGGGAFIRRGGQDHQLKVSAVDELKQASLSTGNIGSLSASSSWLACGDLLRRVNRHRGYGDFYHYHLLAAGCLDIVMESDVNIYDVAALCAIVEEAGGRVSELGGGPLGLESRSILATNGKLHDQVLELIGY